MAITPSGPMNFMGAPFGMMNAGQGMQVLAQAAQSLGMNMTDSAQLSPFAQFSLAPEEQQKVLEFYRQLWMLQQQMQQQIATGDYAGAQQTQRKMAQLQQQLGGRLDPIQAPPPQAEWPNGGGPPGAGPEVGGGPGANARPASPDDFHGGTPMGRELASIAVQHATDGTGDGHHCYRNVKQDLARVGINVTGGSAYQAADQLAQNPRVQEVQGVSREDLRKLPPGAIVVWNRGNGHEHGHISIATGDGREASDVMRRQITNYGTSYRVFLPNDRGGQTANAGGGATRRG